MVHAPIKPKTLERQEIIDWLNANGYPALPVAPAQDAKEYPKTVKNNPEKGVWQHCLLTSELQPIPLYTGKNPSYLDQDGKPHVVTHQQYQDRLPNDHELKIWFANPLNGIGTLGGWSNTVWLDFDVKQFPSEDDCTQSVTELLQNDSLNNTFLERSHSGGWRIGVRVKEKPSFTNFALTAGGKHIGEALGEGRFTVLAPTVGPSGNPYQSINRALPVEVESLESIGVYSSSTKRKHQGVNPQSLLSYVPGSIRLEELGTHTSREILNGSCPTGDRSEALTTALNEWYGWQNWAKENDIDVTGTPEDLAHYAGSQLGIDSDKVNRILKTIDIVSSDPAALHRGGDESCWKKIHHLDKAAFEAKCPAHIKDGIKAEWRRHSNKTSDDGGSQGDRIAEDNKPSNNKSPQLTIREAIAKAEEILATEPDSLLQKIKLEELRQQTGINSYEWNAEYINLIRSKLERQLAQDSRREQRRQALLAIAIEKDPDERQDLIVALSHRSKWSHKYIEARVESLKAEEIKPKAKRMSFKEFMEAESEPIQWIYPGLIPMLGTTLFSGDAGVGKSSAATDLAVSFLARDEFLGETPGVSGGVLYVMADEPDGYVRERLMHRFPLIECPQFEFIPHWDVMQMDLLVETIKDFQPKLVIVDGYNAIHSTDPNYDENNSKAGKTLRTFDALSQTYGCGFVVIHHNGKGKDAKGVHKVRGSTDIPAAASTVLLFEKCPNGVYRQIKVEKTRAGTGNRTLTVGFDESTKRLVLVNGDAEDKETKSLSQHIFEFLKKNEGTFFEQCEVQMHLQLNNNNSVYAALKRLADRSQIVKRPSKKINVGKRCLIYGIPSTVTPPHPAQDTPPPVYVKVSDLEAERYTTQGVDKSDIKSDIKSDVNLTWELSNEYQNSSNEDSMDNSVNLTDNMAVGGGCSNQGVSDSTVTPTPDNVIAPDPWEEKYTVVNVDADGWGEIVRKEKAIAPISPVEDTPQPAEVAAEVESPTAETQEVAPSTECLLEDGHPFNDLSVGATVEFFDTHLKTHRIGTIITLGKDATKSIAVEAGAGGNEIVSFNQAEPIAKTPDSSQPTLVEMQALLLACKVATEVKQLTGGEHRTIAKEAYRTLSFDDQLEIDKLMVAKHPFPVYKCLGSQDIKRSVLVKAAAENAISPDATFAFVKLLNGENQTTYTVASKELVEVVKVIQGEAIAPIPLEQVSTTSADKAEEPKWAWSKTTGESLGKVISIQGNQVKVRRSGESAHKAKVHALKDITFDNPIEQPVSQALSLDVSSAVNAQWEGEQFLEELDD